MFFVPEENECNSQAAECLTVNGLSDYIDRHEFLVSARNIVITIIHIMFYFCILGESIKGCCRAKER